MGRAAVAVYRRLRSARGRRRGDRHRGISRSAGLGSAAQGTAVTRSASLPLDLQAFLAANADAQPGLLPVLVDLIAEYGDADAQCADHQIKHVVPAHTCSVCVVMSPRPAAP